MWKEMKVYEITGCAALAAISAALQIVHVGYPTQWGMWIDIVAIPWILAFFLFGGKAALSVSLVGSMIITVADPSGWLGASMKWLATLPMWLIPWMFQRIYNFRFKDFKKLRIMAFCLFLAVIIRGLIMIPTNYFYALPIWTGWTPEKAMSVLPWWIIFSLNAIQGIIEVVVAWVLVFVFKLKRFATWQ
jgi:riboflavin transporter FmnP